MEDQMIVNMSVGLFLAASGWIGRSMWGAIRHIEVNYVRRDDYREDMSDIKKMLGAIFDKLDNKADK
jgi:hypothetical protein